MTEQGQWFHRRGTIGRDGWESVVDAAIPGWTHTGIRIGALAAGESLALAEDGVERIIVPLAGSFTVQHTEQGATSETTLAGRRSVFDGPVSYTHLTLPTILRV